MFEQTKANINVHMWKDFAQESSRGEVECGDVVVSMSQRETLHFLLGKIDEMFDSSTQFLSNLAAKGVFLDLLCLNYLVSSSSESHQFTLSLLNVL